jgi:homogentisate phytyltransferase / homogentisate geranylgeranyltransferase
MKFLITLWQFSRPHTIIGSLCSISALYIIACNGTNLSDHLLLYTYTLVAALACNVFIVSINQLADVEMDKINKPYLPLAAGTLSRKNGFIIVYTALAISLVFALLASLFYFGLVVLILLIGVAYSLPPLYLKQHHLPAAIAITLVRGFLVNVGIFLHFQKKINGSFTVPDYVWCLTFFIMAFSISIAWFKDLPDTEGDKKHNVKTLALLYSKKNALWGGTAITLAAYVYVLFWSFTSNYKNLGIIRVSHMALLLLFLLNFLSVNLNEAASVKKFYLRFWVFFFAEYIIFSVWMLL